MKKNSFLEQELKKLYEIPKPVRKYQFLQSIQPKQETISMPEFMWQQLYYMKKRIWISSGGILLLFMFFCSYLNEYAVVVISAVIPFLALVILTECSRSRICRMEELELATRFSLPSVWLARMGALTLLHTTTLMITMLFLGSFQGFIWSSICYILVPYFMTVCIGIFLLRQPAMRESYSVCYIVPILVSVFIIVSRRIFPMIYAKGALEWWVVFLIMLLGFTIKENYLFYKQTKVLA